MRCSACGARCDPNRSFCQRCGSAVFLDDASFLNSRIHAYLPASQPVQAPGPDATVQAPERRVTQAARQAARRTVRAATTPAVGAGCVGSLVRWAIFFAIASYAYTAIGRLPEVRQALRSVARGDHVDSSGLANALRSLLGLEIVEPPAKPASTPSSPSPGTTAREAERPSSGRSELPVYNRGRSGSLRRRW